VTYNIYEGEVAPPTGWNSGETHKDKVIRREMPARGETGSV